MFWAASCALAVWSPTADAQRSPIQSPREPVALQFSLGPAFGLDSIETNQLKLAFEGQYHLDGNGLGPAIGGGLHLSVTDGFEILSLLFRFQYDIEATDGFLIGPLAHIGPAILFGSFDEEVFFELGFGVDLKLAFGQFYLFLRPVYIDILIGDPFTAVRYDLLFGGGVTF